MMYEYKIINEPDYAKGCEFIVARKVDDEFWFWGAYSDGFKADKVASEIGGVVFHNVRFHCDSNKTDIWCEVFQCVKQESAW